MSFLRYGCSSRYGRGQWASKRPWQDKSVTSQQHWLRQACPLTMVTKMATSRVRAMGDDMQHSSGTSRIGNATKCNSAMWWYATRLLTLKYKAGRSVADRDRTRSRIRTADAADLEYQGWPNTTAKCFHPFPWSALQFKSTLRLVITLLYQLFVIYYHPYGSRPGLNSKGREGYSSSLPPSGHKTHSASLPTCIDLYSQAQLPLATLKLIPQPTAEVYSYHSHHTLSHPDY
jgi:hypothetical protein